LSVMIMADVELKSEFPKKNKAMIDRVLIAEDHESTNLSLQKTLEDLKISHVDHVYYCDDALLRIRNSANKNPYDLLITDLYFEEDGNAQTLKSGVELIAASRLVQPELKVLVFTAETRYSIIHSVIHDYSVDGFVRKARHDARELRMAIEKIGEGHQYIPRTYSHTTQNAHQFSDFDITIISLLSEGYHQKDIPEYLKDKNIRPSSLSSIEKRLNAIKESLQMTKNEQLIAYCKDMGVL